ncbi:hypothetical protein DNX69_07645 [Rhodopseudomonas palustris]|uniref:Uncharacterized protein n=1 Tax=Rhodopseudomonas palustris TaxID=1076 RepID=A0A323UJ79_RHOPL|nr:hypothetical protein DNX69_07645 [Rhodopseudomonas palustris]
MANWRDSEARIDQVVGRTFGESVRLSFLKNGTADPARPMVDIVAVLHCGGDHSAVVGSGFETWLSAGKAELVIDRSTYTGAMPRKLDKVRANDRAGTPWFEVAAVSDRYSNLLVLTLNQA